MPGGGIIPTFMIVGTVWTGSVKSRCSNKFARPFYDRTCMRPTGWLELALRKDYIGPMVKQVKNVSGSTRDSSTGVFIGVKGTTKRVRLVKTTLGNVTVSAQKPSAALVKDNVKRSSQALQRVAERIIRAGVTLPQRKGVPRYSVDEDNPKIVIRKLDGQVTRGQLVNGKFEEFA